MPEIGAEQLLWLGVAVVAVAPALLLAMAWRSGHLDRRQLLRGARNGALVALLLAAGLVGLTTLLGTGQPFLFGTLDMAAAFRLGLLLGVPVGVGYLWLGLAVMAVGLMAGAGRSWATRGAWLATPVFAIVVVSAAGFAFAMAQRGSDPTVITRPGQLELTLQRGATAPVTAAGPTECRASTTGSFTLHAGDGGIPPLASGSGSLATVQLSIVDDEVAVLVVSFDQLFASPARAADGPPPAVSLAPGWTRAAGQLSFSGLLPLDPDDGLPIEDQPWRGTIGWTCTD